MDSQKNKTTTKTPDQKDRSTSKMPDQKNKTIPPNKGNEERKSSDTRR